MGPTVGAGDYTFTVFEEWARPPEHIEMKASGVAVDSADRVYCFNRQDDHPVLVFDSDGSFLDSWGGGLFRQAHSIRIDAHDIVWTCDSYGQQYMSFTTEGRLLNTIGTRGERSDTGVPDDLFNHAAFLKVTHSAGPFNIPTDIAIAQSGELFMTDGYGNARVHKFSADGEYLFSWGEPGEEPGQFNLPHGIWIDRRDRVLVCDRENDRIQIFDQQGQVLSIWPTELIAPAALFVDADDIVYIPEHGHPGRWTSEIDSWDGGLVSVLTLDGERLTRWGGPIHRSCHGVSGDSNRDIYVVQGGEWGRDRRVVKYVRS